MISFLFPGPSGPFAPPCLSSCDANDDGRVDFADAIYVLRFLFRSGEAPPSPGPFQAGPDPTSDSLDCKAGSICL
jgi:hypothetical protein